MILQSNLLLIILHNAGQGEPVPVHTRVPIPFCPSGQLNLRNIRFGLRDPDII